MPGARLRSLGDGGYRALATVHGRRLSPGPRADDVSRRTRDGSISAPPRLAWRGGSAVVGPAGFLRVTHKSLEASFSWIEQQHFNLSM